MEGCRGGGVEEGWRGGGVEGGKGGRVEGWRAVGGGGPLLIYFGVSAEWRVCCNSVYSVFL